MLAFSVLECPTWEMILCPLDLTLFKILDENYVVLVYCAVSSGRCVIIENSAVLIYFAAEA
jgi:hypothetical protein